MSCCEKCWRDANGDPDDYQKLLVERKDDPCTPEEQAGYGAGWCDICLRFTVHLYTKKCMNISSKEHLAHQEKQKLGSHNSNNNNFTKSK